jgi:hypothetical protein
VGERAHACHGVVRRCWLSLEESPRCQSRRRRATWGPKKRPQDLSPGSTQSVSPLM